MNDYVHPHRIGGAAPVPAGIPDDIRSKAAVYSAVYAAGQRFRDCAAFLGDMRAPTALLASQAEAMRKLAANAGLSAPDLAPFAAGLESALTRMDRDVGSLRDASFAYEKRWAPLRNRTDEARTAAILRGAGLEAPGGFTYAGHPSLRRVFDVVFLLQRGGDADGAERALRSAGLMAAAVKMERRTHVCASAYPEGDWIGLGAEAAAFAAERLPWETDQDPDAFWTGP